MNPRRRIRNYGDFVRFLTDAYDLLPRFPYLEDDVPVCDWGEVRFAFDDRVYRIFYGCCLEHVHDQLLGFFATVEACADELSDLTGRDPISELRTCLQLQDTLLSQLPPQSDEAIDTTPGHLEVPPPYFWRAIESLAVDLDLSRLVPAAQLATYSVDSGSTPFPARRGFVRSHFLGRLLPAYFLRDYGSYYLTDPRRLSEVLLSQWIRIFGMHEDLQLSPGIRRSLCSFARDRIPRRSFFPFPTPVQETRPSSCHSFSFAMLSSEHLIFVTAVDRHDTSAQEDSDDSIATLVDAIDWISREPIRFALPTQGEIVELNHKGRPVPKIAIIVACPGLPPPLTLRNTPGGAPILIASLDSLMGIVDELKDVDDLGFFLDYLDEYGDKIPPGMSLLDIFASYVASKSVLEPGALRYDYVVIDPHGGSHLRFDTLRCFWKNHPDRIFLGDPRGYTVVRETDTRVRLRSRSHFVMAIHCRIGLVHLFMTGPFEDMTPEEADLTNLVLEALEDAFARNLHDFPDLEQRQEIGEVSITCIPDSLAMRNDALDHIAHLQPQDELWRIDSFSYKRRTLGVRVVFDEKAVSHCLTTAVDRSFQVNLAVAVVDEIAAALPGSDFATVRSRLQSEIGAPPRYKVLSVARTAAFPHPASPIKPTERHYARAGQRVAELALSLGIEPGDYTLDHAKDKLNTIIAALASDLAGLLRNHSTRLVLESLVSGSDACVAMRTRDAARIREEQGMDVDFHPVQALVDLKAQTTRLYLDHTYLIEKTVQGGDSEGSRPTDQEIAYLLALAGWLHVFRRASDALHYEVGPIGIHIGRDYTVKVEHDSEAVVRHEEYAKDQARRDLKLLRQPSDSIDTLETFLPALDDAFRTDLGFSFANMIAVLATLAQWPFATGTGDISECYHATGEDIARVCDNQSGVPWAEAERIVDFLTLRSEDVDRVGGEDEASDDIPTWEAKRRHARYRARPLLRTSGEFLWGAMACEATGTLWSAVLDHGSLPVYVVAPEIGRVIERLKDFLSRALVAKAAAVLERFTPHVETNVRLDRRDKKGNVSAG